MSISCGLISAFITFLIAQIYKVFKHKNRIDGANQFLINQLRMYIMNGGDLPPLDILRRSASRKYEVKIDEIFDSVSLLEEVAAGVVGNVYLSIDQQMRFLEKINAWISMELEMEASTLAETNLSDSNRIRNSMQTLTVLISVVLIIASSSIVTTTISEILPLGEWFSFVALASAVVGTLLAIATVSLEKRNK